MFAAEMYAMYVAVFINCFETWMYISLTNVRGGVTAATPLKYVVQNMFN